MDKIVRLGSTPSLEGLHPTPRNKIVIPPDEGIEGDTYYVAHVALSENNVVHKAIFFSGFWCDGRGYASVWNHSYDIQIPYRDISYLHIIKKIEGIGGR